MDTSNSLILEWKPSEWLYVREYLGLSSSDVFDDIGVDPYNVENRIKTDNIDKSRLANYYNRLLAQRRDSIRMSLTPPKRKKEDVSNG